MRSTNEPIYDRITSLIVAQLERGVIPWARPWAAPLPYNLVSGRPYRGINILTTMAHELERAYGSSAYVSFAQAKALGGWVRKGEQGVPIVLYKRVPRHHAAGAPESDDCYFLARGFVVFNLLQTGGLEHLIAAQTDPAGDAANVEAACERVVAMSGAMIRTGGDRAAYSRVEDTIYMPPRSRFATAGAYHSTLFHELTHWTGAPHRLDRRSGQRFGDADYAFEELVAELGAAFVAAQTGIDHTSRAASYLMSWLNALRNERRFIFAAAKLASDAANYLVRPHEADEEFSEPAA